MQKLWTLLLVLVALLVVALASWGDDDPGVEDDDEENDCPAFHKCHFWGHQYGYCFKKKGHDGRHECPMCGKEFDYKYDDDD